VGIAVQILLSRPASENDRKRLGIESTVEALIRGNMGDLKGGTVTCLKEEASMKKKQ